MADMLMPQQETGTQWRRYGWPAMILAVAAVFYGTSLRQFSGGLEWSNDYAGTRLAAADSGRPILIEFFSPSCPYCTLMDREVLARGEVEELLSSFERVRLNAWQTPELSEQFNVEAVPAFIVLDSAEGPVGRVEGYIPVEDFTAFLRRTLEATAVPPVP